jgi:hypothetical protein
MRSKIIFLMKHSPISYYYTFALSIKWDHSICFRIPAPWSLRKIAAKPVLMLFYTREGKRLFCA